MIPVVEQSPYSYSSYDRGVLQSTTSGFADSYVEHRSMSDEVTPDFRTKSRRGDIINNPMQQVISKYITPPREEAVLLYRDGAPNDFWGHSGTLGNLGADYMLVPPTVDLDDQVAIKQAYSSVGDQSFDALCTALESRETVGTLLGVAIRARKLLRRKDYRTLIRDFRKMSTDDIWNQYLEIRYAFRPLYYDAHSVLSAISAEYEERMTSRGFTRGEKILTGTHVTDNYWGAMYRKFEQRVRRTVEIRAGVLYQMDREWFDSHLWGLANPVGSFWEATRLSFLIDWIVNIGDTIGSFVPKPGISHLASWTTTTSTIENHVSWTVIPDCVPGYNARDIHGNGYRTEIFVTKTRTPGVAPDLTPEFNPRISTLKLIDAYAIFRRLWVKDALTIRRIEHAVRQYYPQRRKR
jgi:hypothetical protein